MSTAQAVCPSCNATLSPGDTVCPTCGLLLTGAPLPPLSASDPLAPGTLLAGGRFSVLRRLGQGGMGTLYLATDHSAFDRPVVLKVLLPPGDPADAQEARERFLAEARMLARLKYPTIPQIFAHFQEGDRACIVMEYVEGRDLLQGLSRVADDGTLIPGGPYPAADVVRWGIDLCRKLEYLARQQPPVVHQDIKPANLVLDQHSEELFLVDFGTVRSHRIGATQAAFGTPGYAPPEQYQGRGEPRSDVYALAATLYHLASDDDPGEHPFQFPRLATLGPLGNTLRPALNRDPATRLSAAELRRRLETLAAQPEARSTPAAVGRTMPAVPRAPSPALAPVAITAPDGVELFSPDQLAGWCERDWDRGISWLYSELPDRVESRWGDAALARALYDIARQYGRRNAGLHAALLLLDPAGYGAAPPEIRADRQQLDFGQVNGRERRWLLLTNTGRRYVEATIRVDGPLVIDLREVGLRPGQQAGITVDANVGHYPQGQQVKGEVLVRVNGQLLLRVPAQLEAGMPGSPLTTPDGTTIWIVGALVLGGLVVFLLLVLAR